ncbi:hypothetical protein [Chlorobium phaeovibrioides]|uniref:hypothetical protein n=1 Tax=Chlorobium phaeovibrioides TaxID=1094 RepID=UPI00294FFD39|nr:hypothetical protein [Chlorobium phaeovibrioides]
MKPICINGYCFDRIHLWVQYHKSIPLFIEVVVEVFYPKHRQAEGLVMFNHGFLIGNDLLYYPKKSSVPSSTTILFSASTLRIITITAVLLPITTGRLRSSVRPTHRERASRGLTSAAIRELAKRPMLLHPI